MANDQSIAKTADCPALNQAVIAVLVFFDLFDFPLAWFEVRKYLPVAAGLAEAAQALEQLRRTGLICCQNGFYFLPGREEVVRTRVRRFNYAQRKIKIARRFSRLFRLIPGVRLVCVGNMIGNNNLKDGSDIDLFIIVRAGQIWTARFACVMITKLLGRRPTARRTKDTICLSFFVSDQAMDISGLMLDDDPYYRYWLVGLEAVYDRDHVFEHFWRANGWIGNNLPNIEIKGNWKLEIGNSENANSPEESLAIRSRAREGILETILKNLQLRILSSDIRSLMNKDTRVVVNDSVLKLHINDRRQEYRDKWTERIGN